MKRRVRSSVQDRLAFLAMVGGAHSSMIFILGALLLLSVSFIRPGVFGGVRESVSDVAAPMISVIGAPFRQVSTFVEGVTGLSDLRAENARLQVENMRLREWYQTALMLESENQSLQALLNVKPDPAHRFITARVIADSGNAFVKSAMVAAGRADNVQKGQAVMSGDGLVGRVIEAGDQSSRVLLLSDVNSHIPVSLEGSRQKAILAGNNSDMPELRYLPSDVDVKAGTRVLTTGDGGLFLQGLPVGEVVILNNQPLVKLYANISRLNHVQVVDYAQDPNLIQRFENMR